jgi:hypothetical protein
MCAEIALSRSVAVGIDIQSIVRTSLHASLTTDAAPVVEINDTVSSPVKSAGRTNFRAWRIIAVVAPHHPKVPRCVGKLALLDMLYPSTKNPHWQLVFLFARHRAGVTANAAVLIDDKAVSHLWIFCLPVAPQELRPRHHS